MDILKTPWQAQLASNAMKSTVTKCKKQITRNKIQHKWIISTKLQKNIIMIKGQEKRWNQWKSHKFPYFDDMMHKRTGLYLASLDSVAVTLAQGSQSLSYHVPLQHSDRWACTPTEFQQISMYPFRISTDDYVPLRFLMTQ